MKKGVDFYFNKEGLMVLTANYLLKKGTCCFSGCHHCPYDFKQKIDPLIPAELQLVKVEEQSDEDNLS